MIFRAFKLYLLLRLVFVRPIVVVIPFIVKVTMWGKLWFIGEKFLMVNALEIFDHIQQHAYQKHQH